MIIRSQNISFDKVTMDIINHTRMSLKCKGLLLWILSRPDDFELTSKEVAKYNHAFPIGIYSGFDELEKLGYIQAIGDTKNKARDELKYIVYDTPQAEISSKFKKQAAKEKAMNEATQQFIKRYLKPNRHFKRNEPISLIYYKMTHPTYPVEWDKICDYILDELTYIEFLSTEYWEIISYYVKITRKFTCEDCGETIKVMSKLNVHHNTYDNHGWEHEPEVIENDLELLCTKCHLERHNKIDQIMSNELSMVETAIAIHNLEELQKNEQKDITQSESK